MLPNEEFALACRAYYEEQGLIVDKTNGEFAHCPLPRGMGETGYYLLWEHHQQQGLLQSRDVGRKCFYTFQTKKWLLTVDYFPDNFFELWDIYDEFSKCSHLHTTDRRIKANKTRKLNGNYDLSHFRTPEANRKRAKAMEKKIEITFPNGKIGVYPSLTVASLALDIHIATLSRWARSGGKVKQGYSARYV